MADMPFFGGVVSTGSGSGGTLNYDALTNRPVVNLTGSPVVISELETGVYNIDGTWKLTADDTERETSKDDLFFVSNDDSGCRLTWITAGEIRTYHVPVDGTSDDITESIVESTDEVIYF